MEAICPSSNFPYSQIVDSISVDGYDLIATGCRAYIVLRKYVDGQIRISNTFRERLENVVSVSLGRPPSGTVIIAYAYENGPVVVKNVETLVTVDQHSYHNDGKLTCCVVHPLRGNIVASADERGHFVVWGFQGKMFGKANWIKTRFSNRKIVHMAWKPSSESLILATGDQVGAIDVIEIRSDGKVSLLRQRREHDAPIVAVGWQWTDSQQENSIFASVSFDGTLRFWDFWPSAGDQYCVKVCRMPVRKGNRFECAHGCWLSSNTFAFSFKSNEVYIIPEWNGDSKPVILGNKATGHKMAVFGLVRLSEGRRLLSIATSREMIVWDVERRYCLDSIATLHGYVYSLSQSLLAPSVLAAGCGDTIRLWDQDPGCENLRRFQTFRSDIKGRVISTSFHPSREGWLAFGTEDGQVAIYDTLHGKLMEQSCTFHQKSVYVVSWGPEFNVEDSDEMRLYSIGDGKLLRHHPKKMAATHAHNAYEDILKVLPEAPSKTFLSAIAWRPDWKRFALGYTNGTVEIFQTAPLKLMQRMTIHKKLVNCIRWQPVLAANRELIATGSVENIVFVIDLAKTCEQSVITESTYQLIGHENRVVDLAWHPLGVARLASASFDSTVKVWSVEGTDPVLLATFNRHKGFVYSVAWSLANTDILFSGDDSYFLWRWQLSEQSATNESAAPKAEMSELNGSVEKGDSVSETASNASGESSKQDAMKRKKPSSKNPAKSTFKVVKSQMNLFPLANAKKADPVQDIVRLAEILYGKGKAYNVDEEPQLALYVDRKSAFQWIELEAQNHLSKENYENYFHFQVWNGNITQAIDIAVQHKKLDWLMIVANLTFSSHAETLCLAYVNQLADEITNCLKCVAILLALHHVEEAIALLTKYHMYKEALVVARIRLPATVIDPLMETAAKYFLSNGSYEDTAKCMLCRRQPAEAIRIMSFRQSKMPLMEPITRIVGITECVQAMSDVFRLGREAVLQGAVDQLMAILKEYPVYSLYLFLLRFHDHMKELCAEFSRGIELSPAHVEFVAEVNLPDEWTSLVPDAKLHSSGKHRELFYDTAVLLFRSYCHWRQQRLDSMHSCLSHMFGLIKDDVEQMMFLVKMADILGLGLTALEPSASTSLVGSAIVDITSICTHSVHAFVQYCQLYAMWWNRAEFSEAAVRRASAAILRGPLLSMKMIEQNLTHIDAAMSCLLCSQDSQWLLWRLTEERKKLLRDQKDTERYKVVPWPSIQESAAIVVCLLGESDTTVNLEDVKQDRNVFVQLLFGLHFATRDFNVVFQQ